MTDSELKENRELDMSDIPKLISEIEQLKLAIEHKDAALKFYADPKNYEYMGSKGIRIKWDKGRRAMDALEKK